jgi:hypothetical protein
VRRCGRGDQELPAIHALEYGRTPPRGPVTVGS